MTGPHRLDHRNDRSTNRVVGQPQKLPDRNSQTGIFTPRLFTNPLLNQSQMAQSMPKLGLSAFRGLGRASSHLAPRKPRAQWEVRHDVHLTPPAAAVAARNQICKAMPSPKLHQRPDQGSPNPINGNKVAKIWRATHLVSTSARFHSVATFCRRMRPSACQS